jgi:glycosyltransferase involved in cell wall biosynthesis
MNFAAIKILIVIPVYNHGKTVLEVIQRCQRLHKDILVIDDGSQDLTRDHFKTSNVQVIYHPRNLGKGAALTTAAGEANQQGYTHMVTMDADLQHLPEDFLFFKQAILQEPSAIIVGKRNFSDPSIPKTSKFGRAFSNFWFRVQTGLPLGDAQSGFRAYPLFIFKGLTLSQTRYDFEIEVLVKASWAGVPVRDLDISVYYPPKEKRISHFQLILDNARLTHLNTRLTLRCFIPWPHKKILETKKAQKFSIFHPLNSIRSFLAHEVSPFDMALAGAVGVFLNTLPLIGIHMLSILMVTGFFRLNKLVAIGTSQLCMPPFVPALCIEMGYFLTHGGTFLTDISFETLGNQFFERFYEYCLGSLVLAPILALLCFGLIYFTATVLSGKQENQ